VNELINRTKIGIITALDDEFLAMEAMLDNISTLNSGLGRNESIENYSIGTITSKYGGKHYIALVQSGKGITTAAMRAKALLSHFPNIEKLIMTGIAAGISRPETPEFDVRLGDIVVSNSMGVTQYDYGKQYKDRFEPRDIPIPPDRMLLEKVSILTKNERKGEFPWVGYISSFLEKLNQGKITLIGNWNRPLEKDDPNIVHQKSKLRIEKEKLMQHKLNCVHGPIIFHGAIACANSVLANADKCEMLKAQIKEVRAIEMEGKGITEAAWEQNIGYLVIRGICDYGREDKNDVWHEYAALVAAAYTKALIEVIPTENTEEQTRNGYHSNAKILERATHITSLHHKVIRSLMKMKNSQGLFASYYDEVTPSSTVSSIAALALNEADDEARLMAHRVITTLYTKRIAQGNDIGAWPPQSGEICHTIATAWPLFASLKIQPSMANKLSESAIWIIDKAKTNGDGGWPMVAGGPSRAFSTAYALNSLLEYVKHNVKYVDIAKEAIENGIEYLIKTKKGGCGPFYFWSQTPDDDNLCLATSSMCYHVINKYLNGNYYNEELDSAIQSGLDIISNGILQFGLDSTILRLKIGDHDFRMPTWPIIHIAAPINYSYAYYTPLITVTLIDFYRKQNLPSEKWKETCIKVAQWIASNQAYDAKGNAAFGTPQGRLGIWSTAQAGIILGRLKREPTWIID